MALCRSNDALASSSGTQDVKGKPELTVEMSKKLLADVAKAMQEALRLGSSPVLARDEVLNGWGLKGKIELEDCLRPC